MEGQVLPTNRLKFHESKNRAKLFHKRLDDAGVKLIAAANNHNLIIVGGFPDDTIRGIPLDQLIDFGQLKIFEIQQFSINHQLNFTPKLLSVARSGYSSTLLIAGKSSGNYPVVEFYNLDSCTSIGILEFKDLVGIDIVDYAWHPNYFESVIALCSNRGHLLVVGVSKEKNGTVLLFKSSQYDASSCCWSPKGKNLAVGTTGGFIFRLEPVFGKGSITFKEVDNSKITFSHPRITSEHQVLRLRWVNKSYLFSVHVKTNNPIGPDTIYSLFTIKPSKPYLYWTNVCFENQIPSNYVVHLASLSNSVVCATSASGEAAVIGVLGSEESKSNDLNHWKSLIIDEEGARIELPLDSNNCETFPRGLTTAFTKSSAIKEVLDRPLLLFLTSDGVVCTYAVLHSEDILKITELQPAETLELDIPVDLNSRAVNQSIYETPPRLDTTPKSNFLSMSDMLSKSSLLSEPEPKIDIVTKTPEKVPIKSKCDNLLNEFLSLDIVTCEGSAEFTKEISEMKFKSDYNREFLSLFDEINHLRELLDEVLDTHKIHGEVLNVIKNDISVLDLNMLEAFYLIEYIRRKGGESKNSPPPTESNKIENLKLKTKQLEHKLDELNDHVDVAWEDSLRRKSAAEHKERRVGSLDIIYRTLATNQKVINALKRKIEIAPKCLERSSKSPERNYTLSLNRRDNDNLQFKEFLASRSIVPVRKPMKPAKSSH